MPKSRYTALCARRALFRERIRSSPQPFPSRLEPTTGEKRLEAESETS
jgi:hypothetical protein